MEIVVLNHLTLDGVMQSPAAADEDTRDGFQQGGWAQSDNDEVMGRALQRRMADDGGLLLGRRTYEHFYNYWPKHPENPFTQALESAQKFVASNTLSDPPPWKNSTLLSGDAADAVADLRQQPGKALVVMGSGVLIQSLMARDLIDEYMLMVHPVVLGSGRRLFADGGAQASLDLVESVPTTTGVVIATYRPRARVSA
jgi:dihydrofolate reductase